jgi:hypothetical protein
MLARVQDWWYLVDVLFRIRTRNMYTAFTTRRLQWCSVRGVHLAPVLHPLLIEARRSGAERISGGLTHSTCSVALYKIKAGEVEIKELHLPGARA